MTIKNPLTITAILILGTTLLFWVGFLLTILGVTDLLKNLISAGGPAVIMYGMIIGPIVGLVTAVSGWKQHIRQHS